MMKLFLLERGKPSKLILSSSPQHLEYWIEICYLESASVLKHAEQMFHFASFPNLLYMISLSVWEEHSFGD